MMTAAGLHTDHDIDALQRYAAGGDPSAFNTLIQRYQHMVMATCRRVLRSEADAEDATQETFLKLARNASKIQGHAAAWLHACALGTATDFLRRDSARRRAEQASSVPASDDDRTWRELAPILDSALSELSEADRDVIVAHYLAGRPQKDLALEAGVSAGTMSRRIEKALDVLGSKLRSSGVAIGTVAALGAALGIGAGSGGASAGLAASLSRVALVEVAISGKRAVSAGVLGTKAGVVIAAVSATIVAGVAYVALIRPGFSPGSPSTSAAMAGGIGGSAAEWASVPRPSAAMPLQYMTDMTTDGQRTSLDRIKISPTQIVFSAAGSEHSPGKIVLQRVSDATTGDTTTLQVKFVSIDLDGGEVLKATVGTDATVVALREGDRCQFDISANGNKIAREPMRTRRKSPASDGPDPLIGDWARVPEWTLKLERDAVSIVDNDLILQRFRVLTWAEAGATSKVETICVDNLTDKGAIGKRYKMLVRQDDTGISIAHHEFLSKKAGGWPTFSPMAGDDVRVLTFVKEKP